MSIEDFKGLMDGFDPASMLPELDTVLGGLAPVFRVAVLAGPVLMLLFGLLYIFAAPKEANYHFGYRCYYGMGSVEAWRYTQKLAGIVFAALGLILSVAMLLISGSFPQMETMELLWRTVYVLAAQAILLGVSCLAINTVAALRFDRKGLERKKSSHKR